MSKRKIRPIGRNCFCFDPRRDGDRPPDRRRRRPGHQPRRRRRSAAIAWLRRRPSVGFWYLLRVAQVRGRPPGACSARSSLLSGHEAARRPPLRLRRAAAGRHAARRGRPRGRRRARARGPRLRSLPDDRQRPIALAISAARPGSWPSRRWSSSASRCARRAPAGTSSERTRASVTVKFRLTTATPAPIGVYVIQMAKQGQETDSAPARTRGAAHDPEPGRARAARADRLVRGAPAPRPRRAPASVERSVAAAEEHEGVAAVAADGEHVADRDLVIAARVQVAQRQATQAIAPSRIGTPSRSLATRPRGTSRCAAPCWRSARASGSWPAASTLTPKRAAARGARRACASRGRGRRASAADRARAR